MRVGGPFRLSRHPLNLAPLAILWFNPRISTNLLAYNLVSTIYLVLGSRNEERRLEGAFAVHHHSLQNLRFAYAAGWFIERYNPDPSCKYGVWQLLYREIIGIERYSGAGEFALIPIFAGRWRRDQTKYIRA